MAKKDKPDKPDGKKGKDKGDKKKGKKGTAAASTAISVAAHPRAAAAVKRAKGFGGVGGFVLAAYLSHKAGVPDAQTGARALAAGIAGYIVAWACAVTVWRYLVLAEFRAAVESGRMKMQPAPVVAKGEPGSDAGKPGTGTE